MEKIKRLEKEWSNGIKIPKNVAVCQECGTPIVANVDTWVPKDPNDPANKEWLARSFTVDCRTGETGCMKFGRRFTQDRHGEYFRDIITYIHKHYLFIDG